MKNNPVPITDAARTARNRANAAHSTGPKTAAGKKRSSLNAYRHGLTGQTIILPAADLAAYQAFIRTFFDRYKPVDIIEKQLVQSLADTSFRLNRVAALEHNLMGLGFDEHSDSITTEHPEAHAALVTTEAMREQTPSLAVLSLHTARLARYFEKTLKQLKETQSERRATEATQLAQAAALYQMDKKQGLPYNPTEDGFVFSNSEIETFIRRRDRLKAAAASAYAQGHALSPL
jgi:hypothetical protein